MSIGGLRLTNNVTHGQHDAHDRALINRAVPTDVMRGNLRSLE